MSPRKQPEEPLFPDLEGVEATLDEVLRNQERSGEALTLIYDKLDEKVDRLEKELRTEHTIIIEKVNSLTTNQAVIMAVLNVKPGMGQPYQPGNTNIIVGGQGGQDKTESTGFFASINSDALLKVGLAVLLFGMGIYLVSLVGAKMVQLKSGDKEATVVFENKNEKKTNGDSAHTNNP